MNLNSFNHSLNNSNIAKINIAFDLLKAELDILRNGYHVQDYDVNYNVKGQGLPCSVADGAMAIGICSHGNERWKKTMEDTWSYRDSFGGDQNQCYFAIFDGYNGIHAAEIAANELHKALQREIVKLNTKIHCENLPITHIASLASFLDFHRARQLYIRQLKTDTNSNNNSKDDHLLDDLQDGIEIESDFAVNNDISSDENHRSLSVDSANPKLTERLKNVVLKDVKQAFHSAYAATDTLLLHYGKNEHSRVRWSGCSALTCVFQYFTPHLASGECFNSSVQEKSIIGILHLANAGKY